MAVHTFAHPRWRLIAILLAAVVANALVGGVAGLVAGAEPVAGFVALVALAPPMAAVALRYARLRVVVDGQGVTVVGLFSTRRVPHADLWGFEVPRGGTRQEAKLVMANGVRHGVSALMQLGEGGTRADSTTRRLVGEANAAIAAARQCRVDRAAQ